MGPGAGRNPKRRRVALIVAGAVSLAAGLLVGGVWLAASLRPWLEEALGEALARPVQIATVRPLVSLYPGLVLGDVRVENPPGSPEPVLLEVAALAARLDLPALLQRELRIRGLEMRDGTIVVGGASSAGGKAETVDPRSQLALLHSLSGEQRLRALHVEIVADDGTRSTLRLDRALFRGCGEPAEATARLRATAIQLAGTLECEASGPALHGARARIGESTLRGEMALRVERTGLRVEVAAEAEELILDDLLAVVGRGDTASPDRGDESSQDPGDGSSADRDDPSSPHPVLDQVLDADLLGDPGLALTLRAEVVYAEAGVVRELDFRLRSEPGNLQASIGRARIAEGLITGELQVDAAREPVQASLKLAVDAARLDTLAPDVFAEGTGILDVDVSASGPTPRALLADARGRVQLSLSEALLEKASLGALGRDLFSLLPSARGAERSRRVHCAVVRTSLEAGTGAVLAVVDTPNTTLAGGGTLDLATLSADLLLKPRPRRASVGAVKTPIRISGPLDSPSIAVDKGELARAAGKALGFALLNPLVALVDLGVKGNPCQEAIDRALGELTPPDLAGDPAPAAAEGPPAEVAPQPE